MTDSSVALTILLPVRNETMNLRVMLRILRAVLVMPHEILVIFDDEKDESAPVVAEVSASYPQARAVFIVPAAASLTRSAAASLKRMASVF